MVDPVHSKCIAMERNVDFASKENEDDDETFEEEEDDEGKPCNMCEMSCL